jgi:cell division septation protein DedD
LQVKASYRLKDAEKVRDSLMKERFPAYILSVDQGNGQMVHRVRVGPYQTKDEAQSAMSSYQVRFPNESGGYIVGISAVEAKKYR